MYRGKEGLKTQTANVTEEKVNKMSKLKLKAK